MSDSQWKIHIWPFDQTGGYVWVCRGHNDCYEATAYPGHHLHDHLRTHAGPRWPFVFQKRWWQRRTLTLNQAMAAARLWLGVIEAAQSECEDALEIQRVMNDL